MSKHHKLRVCGHCEWVFNSSGMCPKCGFGHFSAKATYGKNAYKYLVTQKPYWDRLKVMEETEAAMPKILKLLYGKDKE